VLILQNLLNSLKIQCIHSPRGCKWTGNLEQLKAHINNECNSIRIQCKNKGCKVFESRETMPEHEKQCQFYRLTCKSCTAKLRRKDYQYHELHICLENSINCPEDCGQQMKRKDYHKHLHNDCPNFKVICEFSSIGCKTEVPRKSYHEHLKNDVIRHQRLTLTLVSELKEKVKKLEVENEKLRRKISNTGNALNSPSFTEFSGLSCTLSPPEDMEESNGGDSEGEYSYVDDDEQAADL